MFRVYAPGDVFGRVSVAPLEAVRSMSIVSLDESETFELFRAQLDELRAAHPVVNDALLGIAGVEMRRLAEQLVEMMFVDADRRVRRRLLDLGQQYREPRTGLTVIPLTQDQIAQLAGTSRLTVSRVLAQEQRRGTIVKRRRTIALLDAEGLSRSAGWPDDSVPAALR
jgi:CRP-like cAMP-binding protein